MIKLYCYIYYSSISFYLKYGRSNAAGSSQQDERKAWRAARAFVLAFDALWAFICIGAFQVITGSNLLLRIPHPALFIPIAIGIMLLDRWIISSYYKNYEKEFAHLSWTKKITRSICAAAFCLGSLVAFCYIAFFGHVNGGKPPPQVSHGLTRLSDIIIWTIIASFAYFTIVRIFKLKDK